MKKNIFLIILIAAFVFVGCAMEKEYWAEATTGKLIKIDTAWRYPDVQQVHLTWHIKGFGNVMTKCEYNHHYRLGTVTAFYITK